MAFSNSTVAPGSGSGPGGLTITGFEVDEHTQTTNFTAGSLSILLSQTPVSEEAIEVDYNGQKLLKDTAWSYNVGTNSVDILFGDPYVTDYDQFPVFQIQYPY